MSNKKYILCILLGEKFAYYAQEIMAMGMACKGKMIR